MRSARQRGSVEHAAGGQPNMKRSGIGRTLDDLARVFEDRITAGTWRVEKMGAHGDYEDVKVFSGRPRASGGDLPTQSLPAAQLLQRHITDQAPVPDWQGLELTGPQP